MKSFINKILDVPKLILTIWIILWVILVILLVFKFCFGMWYSIVVNNESYKTICDFIDNNEWMRLLVCGILYFASGNLICLTCMNRKMYNKVWITITLNISIIGTFFLKNYFGIVGNIIEIIYSVLFIIILNIKYNNFNNKLKNILVPIIYYAILNLWQFTILVVRSVDGLDLSKLPSLIYITMMLDYYIFLIISWIGVSQMGILSIGWFFGKDITILKAEKEKELAKANPNMKKIESIDIRIAELEKEAK